MKTQFATAALQLPRSSAATYDGLFFRSSLDAEGAVPATAPYNLCPDIIRSSTPIADAGTVLASAQSWQTLYDCTPQPGSNYYYLRVMNGAASGGDSGQLGLYCAPAQLILFPSTWKNQPLTTPTGRETVSVSAAPGAIGVGSEPFLLDPLPPLVDSSFHALVAQSVETRHPVPTVTEWTQMSQLLQQALCFGFRNMVYVDPAANEWLHRVAITIPSGLEEPGTLQLTLTAAGFTGCTLGLLADRFTDAQQEIVLKPVQMTSSFMTGIQITLTPGFSASLAVQYWNSGRIPPTPGSSITLTTSYVVPNAQIDEAQRKGVLDSRYARQVARQMGIQTQPQAVVPLGAVSFVASSPS